MMLMELGQNRQSVPAYYYAVMSKGESSRMEREDLVLEESSRVALITLAAGEESPWHHHSAVTEQVVCVSGKITLNLAQASMPVILSSGQRHQILPGVKHSLSNSEGIASTYLLVQQGAYDFVPSSS